MIRKLRLKIVGISLVTVAAVLLSALVVLALSTRSQMVHSSEEHLAAALEGNADKNQLPGSSGQPCFVAEVFTGGTIRLSGSSYYNLENPDLVLDIVRSALEQKNDSGVLKDYSLRYMRRVGVVSVRIAFTDCSMERATMRSLLLRGGLVTLTALLVLTGLSYWLAGFAVRPVRRAWQEQKQFVSDASHELRTPMAVISAQCDYTLERERTIEEYMDALLVIRRQGQKMTKLINHMLDFARLEMRSGKYPDAFVDAAELVEAVCSDMKLIRERGITLEYETKTVMISVNPELFSRLLVNLVSNAYRYGRESGHIRVRLWQEDSSLVLSVADDGIGIARNEQEKIFRRFYQADASRGGEGTGLGLAMVYEIARFYHGTVTVESVVDQGSTFVVRMPAGQS